MHEAIRSLDASPARAAINCYACRKRNAMRQNRSLTGKPYMCDTPQLSFASAIDDTARPHITAQFFLYWGL